jgi:hypothetical protein
MRKLALILATTALFGMAAPAFAVEAGTAAQARTPVAQTSVKATVKAKAGTNAMAKAVHHNRGVNKSVRHDRGLHRGFTHSRHVGYGKTHRHTFHAKVAR